MDARVLTLFYGTLLPLMIYLIGPLRWAISKCKLDTHCVYHLDYTLVHDQDTAYTDSALGK